MIKNMKTYICKKCKKEIKNTNKEIEKCPSCGDDFTVWDFKEKHKTEWEFQEKH
jgi:DNA-directed RNA polymerase subunit RPC12/RpoP